MSKTPSELEIWKKRYEALSNTVQISCNPPDDCNDPVVLKKHMKGCFDQAIDEWPKDLQVQENE